MKRRRHLLRFLFLVEYGFIDDNGLRYRDTLLFDMSNGVEPKAAALTLKSRPGGGKEGMSRWPDMSKRLE